MSEWKELLERCSEGCEAEDLKPYLERLCGEDFKDCWRPKRVKGSFKERYRWIQDIIDSGVPDGRARLILYVISRYLINVLGLSQEEAEREIEIFLENSCSKHGKCGGIYKSWIRSVLRGVSRGGWKPKSLDRLKAEDPQLYEIVKLVLESKGES